MLKPLPWGCLLCWSLLLATRTTLGFQPQSAPPRLGGSRMASASTITITSRPTSTSRSFQRHHVQQNHRSASRLYAFGGSAGGGGFGGFNQQLNANPPIKTKKDVLQRILSIAIGTGRKFISGFTNGYLLAFAWTLIKGPSIKVANRSVTWGLDLGVLLSLFFGVNRVAEFVLALPTKKAAISRQTIMMWSAVIRNMILASYFARDVGGILQMARASILPGVLTYFFARKKNKMFAGMGGMPGGMGGMPGGMPGGQPSPQAMQELLVQMMAMKGNGTMGSPSASPFTTTMGTPPNRAAPPPPGSPSAKSSSPPSSSSPSPPDSDKEKRDNAVDVEFEKTDDTGDE